MPLPDPGSIMRIGATSVLMYGREASLDNGFAYVRRGTLVKIFRISYKYVMFETLDLKYEGYVYLENWRNYLDDLSPLEQLASGALPSDEKPLDGLRNDQSA